MSARFRRMPPPILELISGWSDGPPPPLPDGPPYDRVALDGDLELARRTLREAHHPDPLKRAIAAVGRAGDERDADALETLARHHDLTLPAGEALARVLGDPVEAWWRVCRGASGWGRIEAVGRLSALGDLPAEPRGWLLRHGCRDVVMPEFVAHACATAGRLEDELAGLVDDALLDGACVIMAALVNGGPVEDIDAYEPGPRVATTVLDLLADRAPNVVRMRAAADLLVWAEDYEQHVTIAERCGRLLGWDEARRYVAARIERRHDALRLWSAAEAMGLDAWEAGWRHLQRLPHDPALHHQLACTRRRERRERLIAFAERELPLDALASGPEDRCFPAAEHRDAALTLDSLVQRMRPSLWSVAIVAAALLSPVASTRSGALSAVAATDPPAWGAPVEAALRRLAAEDPTATLRDGAAAQLDRLEGS